MRQGHFSSDGVELETTMRPMVLAGAAALCALAIGIPVGMTLNANDVRESTAEQAGYRVNLANDKATGETNAVRASNADARAADDRAAVAEARARAAEARIRCEKERQEASNRGAVIGGVTGAVLGSQVAGNGAKSEGAVIGGGVGILTGRQVAKKDHRC
jgi:hypothetical protein